MYSHDRTIASAQVIAQLLPNLSADERKLAKEPGMGGRIWFGQGLVFDEAYGILMTLGILTDPTQAGKEVANTSGQSTNQGWYNRFVQTDKTRAKRKPTAHSVVWKWVPLVPPGLAISTRHQPSSW